MKEIIIVFITAVFTIGAWGQGVENGHEYVDLGLPSGTLWATCNVGAEMPEAFGDYFAWGETETHYLAGGDSDSTTWKEGYSNGYDWTTYKLYSPVQKIHLPKTKSTFGRQSEACRTNIKRAEYNPTQHALFF